jgi:hypothetical protein
MTSDTYTEELNQCLVIKYCKWKQRPMKSHDSAVGIATAAACTTKGVEFRVTFGSIIFNFSMMSRPNMGPTSYPVVTRASLPGVKAAGA